MVLWSTPPRASGAQRRAHPADIIGRTTGIAPHATPCIVVLPSLGSTVGAVAADSAASRLATVRRAGGAGPTIAPLPAASGRVPGRCRAMDRTRDFLALAESYAAGHGSTAAALGGVRARGPTGVAAAAAAGRGGAPAARPAVPSTPSAFTRAAGEVSHELQVTSKKIAELTQRACVGERGPAGRH